MADTADTTVTADTFGVTDPRSWLEAFQAQSPFRHRRKRVRCKPCPAKRQRHRPVVGAGRANGRRQMHVPHEAEPARRQRAVSGHLHAGKCDGRPAGRRNALTRVPATIPPELNRRPAWGASRCQGRWPMGIGRMNLRDGGGPPASVLAGRKRLIGRIEPTCLGSRYRRRRSPRRQSGDR